MNLLLSMISHTLGCGGYNPSMTGGWGGGGGGKGEGSRPTSVASVRFPDLVSYVG